MRMGRSTYDEVNLMLHLYDMRREHGLRTARSWFLENFRAASSEEVARKYPEGGTEAESIKMVLTYWEMAASIVNRGLVGDELFFESNGELWVVWEWIRPFVPIWRQAYQNPHLFSNVEEASKRMEIWREAKAPGSSSRLREILNR
jgi:hypothetical protein